MTEGVEAVGEAMTGGLAARAVEPQAGEGAHASACGGACLNCGAELTGPYCRQCGQRGQVHRTVSAFLHDIGHSVLHVDGKIWNTLPLLAWRPGELTRRYAAGERAKFVSPMALFLFSVFLMFAVLSLVGGPFEVGEGGVAATPEERAAAQREFDRETQEARAELSRLRSERRRLAAAGQPLAGIDTRIRQTEMALALQEQVLRRTLDLADAEAAREAGEAQQAGQARREGGGGGDRVVTAADEGGNPQPVDFNIGVPAIDAAIDKASANPSLLFYKIQTNAYKFSWALIPISVPFVWMLFLHRRRYRRFHAYDHVVFVTYSIAFMSLGFIALSLLRPLGLGDTLAIFAIMLVPPWHMYRQLRGAYDLSRFSALWRTAALLVFASVAATLFLVMLVTLGAFS